MEIPEMKSSQAKPLTTDELNTLALLFQRWTLTKFPYYGGSSEESDATQTFYAIREQAVNGVREIDEEEKEHISTMIAELRERQL